MSRKPDSRSKRSEPEVEEDPDDVFEMPELKSFGPTHLINHPEWFSFVMKAMSMESDVDIEALCAEFPEEQQRTRKGDFGKDLSYVPAKFIRERLNDVLDCKWSFFPMVEERVVDPIPTYSKQDDVYRDSAKYLKVLGVLVIPGLGVQAQYGVKKTLGFNESDNWKAAATDAFKKCAAAFGIEADYEIEDDDESSSSAPTGKFDLEDVEYDDDSLEDALQTEISFGKFKDLNLEEIMQEDESYVEWLAGNARDEDVREAAQIVLKAAEDEAEAKAAKRKDKKAGKSGKTAKPSKKPSKPSKREKEEEPDDDDDDAKPTKEDLIDEVERIFGESDEYDTVTIKELIKSISTSKKFPNGKRKLEDLSEKELSSLITVISEVDE